MTNSIVVINVTESVAPAPLTLQSTGALISQGGTNLAADTYSLLTQDADLTPLLATALNISSITWSGGTALVTTAIPITGLTTGNTFITTISGASPAGFNGTVLATVTGASSFTFPLANNPGTETVPGTYTPGNQGELSSMVATFFGQGSGQSVYVLELGPANGTTGPTALSTWITANPNIFYSYLVPRSWDNQPNFLTLVNQNLALTAKTYFFVTTTTATYSAYTDLMKSVFAIVEAPGIPLSEFSLAAPYQVSLSYSPSVTQRMVSFAFSFLFGVTPYPTVGNSALLAALKATHIGYVGTGAEGGISNTILFWGQNSDGNDFSYWYSIDWAQLNYQQAIANYIINVKPPYNQFGVNSLQDVCVGVTQNAITFGLANGTVARATLPTSQFIQAVEQGNYVDQNVINAVPFIPYTTQNPSAYPSEVYGGLSAVYIVQRYFQQIIFNLNVTNFISQ
jgi:hypothetical protein